MKKAINKQLAIEVLFTPDEFVELTSSEICKIIRYDKQVAIVGGEDHKCGARHIVRFSTWKDLMEYSN